MKRVNLLLLGDSLTQYGGSAEHEGWAAEMSNWYQRKADVTNRGFSGYNSRWFLQVFAKMFPNLEWNDDPKRNLVTLLLGSNDACRSDGAGQFIDVAEYTENLRAVITRIRSVHAEIPIILITPPRVDADQWEGRCDEFVTEYANVVRSLAAELGTELVDLWKDFDDSPSVRKEDLYDGLHFGKTASAKLFTRLKAAILRSYPSLDPAPMNEEGVEILQPELPWWKTLAGLSKEDSNAVVRDWTWTGTETGDESQDS
jgi:lysophospholipase L1-like esterase